MANLQREKQSQTPRSGDSCVDSSPCSRIWSIAWSRAPCFLSPRQDLILLCLNRRVHMRATILIPTQRQHPLILSGPSGPLVPGVAALIIAVTTVSLRRSRFRFQLDSNRLLKTTKPPPLPLTAPLSTRLTGKRSREAGRQLGRRMGQRQVSW